MIGGLLVRCTHETGERHGGGTAFQPRELRERDVGECTADRAVHTLPDVSDAAVRFDTAVAVLAAALGDRERSFERVENARGADLVRRARKLIAAVTAARRDHETAALKFLQ